MDVKNALHVTRIGTGCYDDDGHAKRTGNLNSAVGHITTAVIGSGVLSLSWSIAQLGWIGGPVFMLFCAVVTSVSSCIIVHLVGGYQIYCQPIYSSADTWCSRKFPNSGFVNKFYKVKQPLLPGFLLNFFRFSFRTTYVTSTIGLAILFPYFNQVLGVLGALIFWPLAIYFPVEMYSVQKKIGACTRKWIILRSISFVCFPVAVVGLVGSLEGIIHEKHK